MPTMLIYVLQLLALAVVPLVFAVWLAAFGARSWLAFIVKVLVAGSYLALILIAGRWDIVGTWLRPVWPVVFAAALTLGWLRCRGADLLPPMKPGRLAWLATNAAILGFFGLLLWKTLGANRFEGAPVALHFPLEATRWYVAQGGSVAALNAHNPVPAQRYAVDITGLNSRGFRAGGLYPQDLEAYVVFGNSVTAPCEGRVVAVENELSDLLPPRTDAANPAGNHVLLRCGDVFVLLAHFKRGTVSVKPGDEIQAGAPLGVVGNSGNTSEPHLHIHAVRAGSADVDGVSRKILATGEAVPMLFDGRFLTRNATGDSGR